MIYRAAVDFYDLQDDNRFYEAGEQYPRPGLSPSPARLADLSSNNNRMGHPLIIPQVEPKPKRARRRVESDA